MIARPVLRGFTFGLAGLVAAAVLLLLVWLLLRQLAMPRISVFGRFGDSHDFVSIEQHPQAVEPQGVLILRPEQPLFFANAESVMALVRQQVEAHPRRHTVVLSLEESADLDSTALEALADFAVWLSARDITLRVARLKDVVRQLLERAALPQLPPSALDFWSVEDAASASVATPPTRGSGQ